MPDVSGAAAAIVLIRREILHYLRQPARIAAAIGTPILIWLFLASGFSRAFAGDRDATDTFLPGAVTLAVVFAAIFSSISIIDDRRGGWLQSVIVSPVPRWAVAAGTIGGGALAAWAQATLVLLVLPVAGVWPGAFSLLLLIALLGVTAIAVASTGFAFAWRCESTQAYHAIMNLVFMPMWLLSGAFFPPDAAAPWLAFLMHFNPLTWCTNAIRSAMGGEVDATSICLTVVFAAAAGAFAMFVMSRPERR